MATLIQRGKVLTLEQEGKEGQYRGGKRGKVKSVSRQARNRFMRFVGALTELGHLITLTYPDSYSPDPTVWKRDLKVFAERMKRLDSTAGFVWRLGLRRRKSGKRHGEIAPHFHLIFYGDPALLEQHRANWSDISGMEVWYCEKIETDNGVGAFISKFSSLAEEVENLGRWWGAYFRHNLPIAEAEETEISDSEAAVLLDRMKERAGITRKLTGNRLTILATIEQLQ